MTEILTRRATLDELLAADGKAELINGRIVELPMPGDRPGRVAFLIAMRLHGYVEQSGRGSVYADGVDFVVPELESGRESFRPDCSYYDGPHPANPDDAIPGPPTFAVEVRSKEDHAPAAERTMAAKRADYFEAGTLAVWAVDPRARTITLFTRAEPETPAVFRSGDVAHAEPAVPGWRLPVDSVFA